MSEHSQTPFLDFLKRSAAPVGALVYLLAFIAQIRDYADKLGWRIVFILILCLAVAWCVFTWTVKEMTLVEPRRMKRRYGAWVRYGAVAATISALLPLAYALRPEQSFPQMPVHLVNQTNSTVQVGRWGEFYLSIVSSPMNELQVAAGRLRILGNQNPDNDYISVRPGTTKEVVAEFVNSKRLIPMLDEGDHSVRFMLYQRDGQILTQGGILFTRQNIGNKYLLLELRKREGEASNGT